PNLYPHVQPQVYPPPPNPQGQGYQQYQGYLGEENPSYSSYGWSQHPPPAHSQQGPFQHYQEDPDCITFLRGCNLQIPIVIMIGIKESYQNWDSFCWAVLLLPAGAMLPLIETTEETKPSGESSSPATLSTILAVRM
ncbi:hypothetical protein EJB05_38258, partial [Eragrostis curvula]